MKFLITGATGLIGSELVSLLLSKGYSVNYLTSSKLKINNKDNFKGFYWNVKENEIDADCVKEVEVIIHLAGANIAKRWTNDYKKEIIESRVATAKMLVELLKNNQHQVTHVISASAIGIYPDSLTKIYDETFGNRNFSFLSEVVCKWEESVDEFTSLGIRVAKVRTGLVLSEKGGALPEMIKPIKLGLGAVMGNGKQIQSWIHIDDLISIYYFIAENKLEGIFNAVSPNPVNNSELTNAISDVLNKKIILPNIPKFVMKLILGEMHLLLFSSQKVSSEKIIKKGFLFKFPHLKEALGNLLYKKSVT